MRAGRPGPPPARQGEGNLPPFFNPPARARRHRADPAAAAAMAPLLGRKPFPLAKPLPPGEPGERFIVPHTQEAFRTREYPHGRGGRRGEERGGRLNGSGCGGAPGGRAGRNKGAGSPRGAARGTAALLRGLGSRLPPPGMEIPQLLAVQTFRLRLKKLPEKNKKMWGKKKKKKSPLSFSTRKRARRIWRSSIPVAVGQPRPPGAALSGAVAPARGEQRGCRLCAFWKVHVARETSRG